MNTKHLTVMFTDIKGYTSRTSSISRNELLALLEEHERLIRPVFVSFGGTVIKTIGDAFLVTFESPTDAVLCGMKVQEVLRGHNAASHSDQRLEIRVAINSGEVTVKDGDVFGEPVNIAARIEGIAEPNEVYFTEAVYLAMNKSEVPSAEVGLRYLKGIPNEIKVYKVLREGVSGAVGRARPAAQGNIFPAKGSPSRFRWAAVAGVILGILLFLSDPGGMSNVLFAGAIYVYLAFAIQTLARFARTPHDWLSWVPLVQFFYPVEIAKKSRWWHVLYLIPGVNLIFIALTWMALAEARGAPSWIGLLILVPGIQVFLPGYLAFVRAKEAK